VPKTAPFHALATGVAKRPREALSFLLNWRRHFANGFVILPVQHRESDSGSTQQQQKEVGKAFHFVKFGVRRRIPKSLSQIAFRALSGFLTERRAGQPTPAILVEGQVTHALPGAERGLHPAEVLQIVFPQREPYKLRAITPAGGSRS
jgi:hypothetical protein